MTESKNYIKDKCFCGGKETYYWTPAVDVIEEKEKYVVEVDLPGIKKDILKINLKEGILSINGERKTEIKEDGDFFRYYERPTGEFERSFRIPKTADGDNITASYKNGVLKLEIPKKEEAQPLTINITD
jgi:HSP20 family protein